MSEAQLSRPGDLDAERESLIGAFTRVRAITQRWAAPLSDEDQAVQSMPDASPVKWHLAHTTWFWENFLLKPYAPHYRVFDETFSQLFNSYYVSLGDRHPRPERGLLTRPSAQRVRDYRAYVDAAMARWLETAPPHAAPLVSLGLAHEEQHQELILMDLQHLFSRHPFGVEVFPRRAPDDPVMLGSDAPSWTAFDGGLVEVGAEPAGDFAFDNETPRHRVFVEPFDLANRPVSNAEVEAFIQDGGYQTALLWLSDGWAEIQVSGRNAPDYWRRDAHGGWLRRTLAGDVALDPAAPAVHLSYYEADAIATWLGARLPDEREWEIAARSLDPCRGVFAEPGVAPEPRSDDGPGLRAMFGDVWEWTRSAYAPYPGYRAARGALGEYNAKFMVGQYVLRGGSCATPTGHVRASYRNFFPPSARWAFSGLRLARDRAP